MKITSAVLLVFSIMLITFSKSIIALQYELNKKFIASTLCENRDKPMMHCNGYCHLKKSMNSDGQKESTPAGTLKTSLEVELFSILRDHIIFEDSAINITSSTYTDAVTPEPYFSIFHPPQAT